MYDQLASRWYVDSIDLNDEADLLFAISNDANPLDGFSTQYVVPLASPGDLSDFPKFGYNADYITLSANDFGDGNAKVTVLNKADALAGTLSYVQLTPSPQFRALVPAQQTTAQPGDPIWFIGAPYLSPGPDKQYHPGDRATRPLRHGNLDRLLSARRHLRRLLILRRSTGWPGSVEANDNTTTQVFDYSGTLVTAIPASTAADGYVDPKVHYYEINVSSGTPVLSLQGVIDPGPGCGGLLPDRGDESQHRRPRPHLDAVVEHRVRLHVRRHRLGRDRRCRRGRRGPGRDDSKRTVSGMATTAPLYSIRVRTRSGPPTSTPASTTPARSGIPGSLSLHRPAARYRLLLGQRQRRRQPGLHHHDAGRRARRVRQQPLPRAAALRPQWQPGRRRRRQRVRRPQLGDRLHRARWRRRQVDYRGHPSPNTPQPTYGEYGLLVTGATGALSPFVVTATTPAAGALVQPPTDIIVTFNDPVLATR